MADVNIIADEIHFSGHLVAIMTTGVPASVFDVFTLGLANGTLFEDEQDGDVPEECPECAVKVRVKHNENCSLYDAKDSGISYEDACDDVTASIKPFVKGGLIKLTDLERVLKELRENKHETDAS